MAKRFKTRALAKNKAREKPEPVAYMTEPSVADLMARYDVTRADLLAVGIVIVDKPPADAAAILCAIYKPGEPLLLPDNETGPCAFGCGRMLQWRPHATKHLPHICEYCAMTMGATQ